MAVVRYLKHCQYQKQHQKHRSHSKFCDFEYAPASESWIGNPLDPIGVIFDTLAEASLSSDSKSLDTCYALVGYDKKENPNPYNTRQQQDLMRMMPVELFVQYNEANCLIERTGEEPLVDRPKYRQVQVAGSNDWSDTYLGAAVTVAIIGLAQHRRAPDLESQRDKVRVHINITNH